MEVLNVAEKNSAAKTIASCLSKSPHRREGLSIYNKIYEFETQLWNQQCKMIMTSVSGHLLNLEFTDGYHKWSDQERDLFSLFNDAPFQKTCNERFTDVKETLEREVSTCQVLIIWTDCDREGENIGYEVIRVCQAVNPKIKIYRARFSDITIRSVRHALDKLGEPNRAISDAVDVRAELDFRIGAAFTRFQTMRLRKVFPKTLGEMVISHGSCQFPTLGFVVERYLAIESFRQEPFWTIQVMDVRNGVSVNFRWEQNYLFEELPCQIFLDTCRDSIAIIEEVERIPRSKPKPLPLNTIELTKICSRVLKLSPKNIMQISQGLYSRGMISYPRTETNRFPGDLDLLLLVEQQCADLRWGLFARRVLREGLSPRQGPKDDGAHPPIYPTENRAASTLEGDEALVYEFIVRSFLACLSKDAEAEETIVNIKISDEKFAAIGTRITAKNYLEVYPYETWNEVELHEYKEEQTFRPTNIEIIKSQTSPPNLLTESDLITLMDYYGIGTNATHAGHIEKIKSRQYVKLMDEIYLKPEKLGIGLVMGYDSMGFEFSKPHLRAELENDLQLICYGLKLPEDVLRDQLAIYKAIFSNILERPNLLDDALARYLEETSVHVPYDLTVFRCPKCGSSMKLKKRKKDSTLYIGCAEFPLCENVVWFPPTVKSIETLDDTCKRCPGNMRLLKFTLLPGTLLHLGASYTSCIGGCDTILNETFNVQEHSVQNIRQANESEITICTSSNSDSRDSETRNQAGVSTENPPECQISLPPY